MNYETSFRDRLRIKLQLARGSEDSNAVLPSRLNGRMWFRDYLLTTHSIIRASVPLMHAAYDRCNSYISPEDKKLLVDLGGYYKKHIQEEMNHDEWILDDLELVGISRQESLLRKPSQAVAELVGSQYYWIHHWHPICLLGYISLLEGNPPKKHVIDELQSITGYPEAAFRTLIKHSDLDPHHRDDLDNMLGTLRLTSKHEQWITSNALYTANKLKDISNESFRSS